MSPAVVVCALIILCSARGNTELLSRFRHATIGALAQSCRVPALPAFQCSKADGLSYVSSGGPGKASLTSALHSQILPPPKIILNVMNICG